MMMNMVVMMTMRTIMMVMSMNMKMMMIMAMMTMSTMMIMMMLMMMTMVTKTMMDVIMKFYLFCSGKTKRSHCVSGADRLSNGSCRGGLRSTAN